MSLDPSDLNLCNARLELHSHVLHLQQKPKILLIWNIHVCFCGVVNSFTNSLLCFTRFWHNHIFKKNKSTKDFRIHISGCDRKGEQRQINVAFLPIYVSPGSVYRKISVVLKEGRDQNCPEHAGLPLPVSGWQKCQTGLSEWHTGRKKDIWGNMQTTKGKTSFIFI